MLEIDNITVSYRGPKGFVPAVKGFSLQLEQGAIGCLLGSSGCGKTTVLRAVAGFEPLEFGRISLDGELLSSRSHITPAEHRHMGMMFQDYALFPHLTVEQNVGFGLNQLDRQSRQKRVDQLLDLVGLADHHKRYPHELSGGQQQRVALARSLAPEPSLLLLDEPFSNLDVDTRERLAFELRDILKQTGHTALLVTHNHDEAFALADKIGVMAKGELRQWDTPSALIERPADELVQDILRRDILAEKRAAARLRGKN